MVDENVGSRIKLIEFLREGFDPLIRVSRELALDPGKAVAQSVVFEAKFSAKVRNNLTKPRVEVFEVLQHM